MERHGSVLVVGRGGVDEVCGDRVDMRGCGGSGGVVSEFAGNLGGSGGGRGEGSWGR